MPAKTVVFTNVRKFDGDKFRWISSGEYIQMSGRAGVVMVIQRTFLRNSFYQFQSDRAIPDLQTPIDESKVVESLKKYLLQVNSHFSSVVVTDKKGAKKIEFRVEDHVIVPSFAPDLSNEAYADLFKECLSKIAVEKLNEKRPLWEIHVYKYPTCDAAGILALKMHHALGDGFSLNEKRPLWEIHVYKYPTCDAAGILALKMHHALGDGFSLMGALFSCLKRADNPSLPLTFPSTAHPSSPRMRGEMKVWKSVSSFVSGFWNTASDFVWGLLQSTLLENDRTVIRSGKPGIEQMPMDIKSDIRQIKSMLGVSVNDVVVGIVFYSIQLYAHAMGERSTNLRRTALVLLNTRMVNGYRSLDDMLEKDLWGNHFFFIHLSAPSTNYGEKIDPLQYIFKAQKAISKYVHSTLRNSSMCISNIVGPVEKMTLAELPVNNIYFFVTGSPQSLLFTIMSYMGKLTIVATNEKGHINSQLMVSCMEEAFKAASQKD
ncbi:hypothetical protein GIB67_034536 [Kingdonia uniflora]|uniref:Diacylglycerol O-acyltransferase n=1 Tax=Kingdonia uniflora TaxID=39325 RepID=A0A7J7PC15_9MAGN|nr:hypothetical protein GIB67_034536 [Kingdonia uniflora]